MSITALKRTSLDHNIASLPDNMVGQATYLKGYFDKNTYQIVTDCFNPLIDNLLSVDLEDSGAKNIGSALIKGVQGNTVYDQLLSLKSISDNIVMGTIPDNSITGEKLINNSVTSDKLDTSFVRVYNATATLSDGIIAITIQNSVTQSNFSLLDGSKVCFFAPCDFNPTHTYTLNSTPITLATTNGKSPNKCWVSGVSVELTISGGTAFFKVGGEFSSGDLLPVHRIQPIYDDILPRTIIPINTSTCYTSGNYLLSADYTTNRTTTLFDLNHGFPRAIKSGSGVNMSPYTFSSSAFVDNYFYYCHMGIIKKIKVLNENIILAEKNLLYQNCTYAVCNNRYIYMFFATNNKILKLDTDLNIIWTIDYTMNKEGSVEIRQGSYKKPVTFVNGKIYIFNNTTARYDILNASDGSLVGYSISLLSIPNCRKENKACIDNDGYLYVNTFSNAIGNWVRKYDKDCTTLMFERRIGTGNTYCLSGILPADYLWVSDFNDKTIRAYNFFDITPCEHVPVTQSYENFQENLVDGDAFGNRIITYYNNSSDYGRILYTPEVKNYLLKGESQ